MKNYGCFLVSFLFLSLPAMADDITLFGGFQHPGKVTLQSAASTGVSGATQIINNPIDVGVFGIRVAHGKVIGSEHTLAYAPNFIDSNTHVIIYNSDLLVQAPAPVINPYFTAGLGAFFIKGTGATDVGSKFALNYGGGIKVFPVGPIGGRIDVRGYSVPGVQSQTLNAVEVSLGLVIKFGH
jgi:hypothetical protein